MKIAVVNDFFPPSPAGGADIFLGEFSKYLERENEVVVLTSQIVKGETGFRTYKLESSPFKFDHIQQIPGLTLPWLFGNYPLQKKIKEIYEKEEIDLVYLNNFYHLSFAPLQAAIDLNIKTVLDVHDYWPICFSKDKYKHKEICSIKEGWKCSFCLSKKFKLPLPTFFLLSIESFWKKRLLNKLDRLFCHSEFVRKKLERNGYQAKVLPYPYIGNTKGNENTEEFRILFVGRLNKKKGADLLIPVAKLLKGNFRIDVLGKGPLSKKLDRMDLNIYTHGFLKKEKMDFFRKADLLLAPSRWPEPFGIVALEAMATQTPIISLEKSGGLKNLVEGNKIGNITTEEDLPKAVESFMEKNRERKYNFSIANYKKEKLFKKYEDFLRTLKG